jgi:mRNA interferase RelE/StbE
MNTEFTSSFEKNLKRIIDSALRQKVKQVILSVEQATTMSDIPELKKLKGYKSSYRIAVGAYRIGIEIFGDMVTFVVFKHRKDVYRFFPR